MDNRTLGMIGERAAAEFINAKGYTILKKNFRGKTGEIDIIAGRNSEISFIEVKTRQNKNYGRPCESVTAEKQGHIRKTAYLYLQEIKKHGYEAGKISFDIIEINIEHIKEAF